MRERSRGADCAAPGAFAVTSEAAIAREAMSNWPAKVRQVRDQPLIAALVARMGRTERVTLFAVIPAASLLLAFASLANGVPGQHACVRRVAHHRTAYTGRLCRSHRPEMA